MTEPTHREYTVAQMDETVKHFLDWGFGGVIIAVFVAPMFLAMVKGAQKRDEERAKKEEAREKQDAEDRKRLIDTLVSSVESQKETLASLKLFEIREEETHKAILASLSKVSESTGAAMLSSKQIAELLERISQKLN